MRALGKVQKPGLELIKAQHKIADQRKSQSQQPNRNPFQHENHPGN